MEPVQPSEYVARHLAEFERLARLRRIPATGETRPVRTDFETKHMARAHVESTLRTMCPSGLWYLYHYLGVSLMNAGDFEAACDHFGLRGVLREITPQDVAEEVRARRERGDPPSTGPLPMFLDEIMPREKADARIAIVERRIAEARAARVAAPAPETA